MRKKIALIVIILIAIFSFQILYTYGVFESEISGVATEDLAKWNIAINGSTVTGASSTFSVTSFSYSETEDNIRSNKFAPGSEVFFDVVINPVDTEVSVRYDISADVSSASNSAIVLSSASLLGGSSLVRTDENVYSGVMSLENMSTSSTIKMGVKWNVIDGNEDVDFNSSQQARLNVPLTVHLSQYLGEDLVEYVEPVDEEPEPSDEPEIPEEEDNNE